MLLPLVPILLFIALTTASIGEGNRSALIVNEAAEFVVDKVLYWVSLFITLSAAVGLGFQGIRWLRKKTAEDRERENAKLEERLKEFSMENKKYVANIADSARERRDKDEYMLKELIRRVDNIEQQQQSQMKIVMQNQQTITDFIAQQQRGGGRPGRPRKDAVSDPDSLAP